MGYIEWRRYLESRGWDLPPQDGKEYREERLQKFADDYVLICDPRKAARVFANSRNQYGDDLDVLQVLIAESYRRMFSVDQGIAFFVAVSLELQNPLPSVEDVLVLM